MALASLLFGQAADIAPAFEVGTVKPSGPNDRVIGLYTYPGGRVTATNYTLKMLVEEAFDLQTFQVSGRGSWSWVGDVRWNIEGKPPASSKSSKSNPNNPKLPPNAEQREMLQTLLADRFQLKVHRQSKEGSVYLLLRGDKDLQLKPAKDANDYPWIGAPQGGMIMGNGIAGTNATMELVATRLSHYMRRPVIDRTGIVGAFDFRFDFPLPNSPGEERPDVIGSILASVRGLGLKLEAGKDAFETLTIDQG